MRRIKFSGTLITKWTTKSRPEDQKETKELTDHRIKIKESELKKLWTMRVTVIPIVTGALWMLQKGLEERLEELEIRGNERKSKPSIVLIGQNTDKSPRDLSSGL